MKNKIATCKQDSPFVNFNEGNKITEHVLDLSLMNYEKFNDQDFDYFKEFIEMKRKKTQDLIKNKTIVENDLSKFINTINNVEKNIPDQNLGINVNLLVVGNVQSGKTDFMLGLTAKLFDRKEKVVNLVFVLSTVNTALLNQTSNRFKNSLPNLDNSIEFLNFNELKILKNNNYQKLIAKFQKNKKIILFLQKQKDHLRIGIEILQYLKDYQKNIGNVVIYDDEGDASSFDNNEYEEQSTINKNITEVIECASKFGSAFISVTATPFAHIMVDGDYNIKPEYGFILEPGYGYLGLKHFSEESQVKLSKIIKPIFDSGDNFSFSTNDDAMLSICHYMIQCYIFQYSAKYQNKKPRMMFNVAREIEGHFEIRFEISEFLETAKKYPSFIEPKIAKAIQDYDEMKSIISDEQITKFTKILIKEIIPKIDIKVLNSDEKSNDDVKLDQSNYKSFEIVIGSDKLGRGLTFNDLTSAFVLRRSKVKSNADTVLQLARWFGYRDHYKHILKIFLSIDLIDDYNITNYAVTELFALIKEFELTNTSLKKIPAIFPVEKMKNDFGVVRKTVVETYWKTGPRSSYMNNKYERSSKKPVKEINKYFFNKFIDIFNKKPETDLSNYPIIKFDSIEDFNQDFFKSNKRKDLHNNYNNLFGISKNNIGIVSERNLIDHIIDSEISSVIIRFINLEENINSLKDNFNNIFYRERKLNISNNENSEYYSFGQGSYAGEEIPVNNLDKGVMYIDIIPIKTWTDRKIGLKEEEFTRARIFIPKTLLKYKGGIVSKT